MAAKATPKLRFGMLNEPGGAEEALAFWLHAANQAHEEIRRRQKPDDLYVLHNPSSGLVKVGRSKDVEKRRRNLEGACGQPLTLLKRFEGKGLCERACHDKLSEWVQSPGREWFSAAPDDVLSIVESVVEAHVPADTGSGEGSGEGSQTNQEDEDETDEQQSPPRVFGTGCRLKRAREDLEMCEIEGERCVQQGKLKVARVQAAVDVARIALTALRDLGLPVTDAERERFKQDICRAAWEEP